MIGVALKIIVFKYRIRRIWILRFLEEWQSFCISLKSAYLVEEAVVAASQKRLLHADRLSNWIVWWWCPAGLCVHFPGFRSFSHVKRCNFKLSILSDIELWVLVDFA